MSGPLRSERKVVGFVRDPLPKVGSLSLKSEHAQADLEHLGWRNVESLDLLWGLSGAGDPDVALNLLIRLYQALEAIGEDARNELDQEIRQDENYESAFLHCWVVPRLSVITWSPILCSGNS